MAKISDLFKREQPAQGGAQQTQGGGPRGADMRGNVVMAHTERSSLMIAAVYRAVELRANTMAQLVMEYQLRDRVGGNFTQDNGPTRGLRLNYLVQVKPNPRQNWVQLMRQAEIKRVMEGNAYIWVERDESMEVVGLWLCATGTYDATRDEYLLQYYVGGYVRTVTADASDVIHLRNCYSTDGGQTGISTLRYATRTLGTAATQDQLTLDTAALGGKRSLIIQEKDQLSMGIGKVARKEMENVQAKLNEEFPNKIVNFVPNVADIKDYSQSMQELQLLESRKFSVREVARLYGVPAIMLMDESNSSYKSPEAATLEFLSRTIAPLIREWEVEMNSKVLGMQDFGKRRFHLCEKPLFRLDRDGQAKWDKARMETGVVSINDLRMEQDLPRIENGDDHYVSTNMAVAGSEKLSGNVSGKEGVEV